MITSLKYLLILFLGISIFFQGMAANLQNAEELRTMVDQYLHSMVIAKEGEVIQIEVGHLDPRLQLNQCTKPLETFLPNGSPEAVITAVGVKCTDLKAWTIYVPVQVKISVQVLIATKNIAKGEVIQENDIDLVKRERDQLRSGFIVDKNQVVGQVASQSISSGTALTQKLIEMPNVILRGQPVILFVRINKVYVEVKGIAQDNGYLNKVIPVLNTSSKKVVYGRVAGAGKVDVSE